jgi:hypothetical protein
VARVPLRGLFENCPQAGLNESEEREISYFVRPYIVWPTDRPGSLTHITHVRDEPVSITRPRPQYPDNPTTVE